MTEGNKFYTAKNDRAFKDIFMNEKNKDILKCLLENILNIEIEEINYSNLERPASNINVRHKRFDLFVKTNKRSIQIEVNSDADKTDYPRNMAYICDTYANTTLQGENYVENYDIIQINLTYNLKYNDLIRKYYIQDKDGNTFVKNFIIYEVNMDKYMTFWYNNDIKEVEKYKYIIMLDLGKNDLELLSKKDKVITRYMEELEKINVDMDFHEFISEEEDRRKKENTRVLKAEMNGIKQGINTEKIEIARNMKENGEKLEVISKYTGLSLKEIENI